MSFRDFSPYIFPFDRLDAKIPTPKEQRLYYEKWMKKYAAVFKCECGEERRPAIEWDLRGRKALRELFSSATFYVEAKKNLEMKCFSSYYFCLYYSLFHATYACISLDAGTNMDELLEITHEKMIKRFTRAFCSAKSDLMAGDIEALFLDLRYRREYYSYVTPFNNLFDYEEDLGKLEQVLLDCYQLANFHSVMIENSYRKHINKVIRFTSAGDIYEFDRLFHPLFSKRDQAGVFQLDPSCEFLRTELIRDGFLPVCIALDLEHQFDEFHTYDMFYSGETHENALNVRDIWSFVARALI